MLPVNWSAVGLPRFTKSSAPSRLTALPYSPPAKVAPLVRVPTIPCPDASAAVVPDTSLKAYPAAIPKGSAARSRRDSNVSNSSGVLPEVSAENGFSPAVLVFLRSHGSNRRRTILSESSQRSDIGLHEPLLRFAGIAHYARQLPHASSKWHSL